MFFIFYFWSWIFEKSSKFWAASLQKLIQPPACWDEVFLESFLPIGCRTFICWKNPPKCVWFGLRIIGFLQIFYSQAVILGTIVESPAFLEYGSAEKIAVCAQPVIPTSRRIRCIFVWSGSEFWSFFKNSRSKLKNQKPIAVDVFFMAFPMIPLWGWSNMAGRYLLNCYAHLAKIYD